jgi:centromere protein J
MATPSVLLRSLDAATPRQQRDDVQDLLQYIDNMSFSPYISSSPKQQEQEHSLYLEEQQVPKEDLQHQQQHKSFSTFQSDTFHQMTPALKDRTNNRKIKTPAANVVVKSKGLNFPELTPIRTSDVRSPTLAYQSLEQSARSPTMNKKSRDPVGMTPLQSKENHLHEESRYYVTTEEEPAGNPPMQAKESHLYQASRYYLDDDDGSSDDGSSLVPESSSKNTSKNASFASMHTNEISRRNLAPTPAKQRAPEPQRAALEPSLEQSMDDAWSIVLGSTIIEEEEDHEEASKTYNVVRQPITPNLSRRSAVDELPERIRSPEDAKKLLRTAVHTLQDARAERESARQWASDMKDTVHKWVEEQQKILRAGSNLSEAQSLQQAQSQSMSSLEESIQKLCQQVQTSNQQRQTTEEKLQQLLIDQQEKIQSMAQELVSMKHQVMHMEPQQGATPQQTNTAHSSASQNKKPSPSKHSPNSNASTTSSTASSRIRKQTKDGGHVIIYGNGVRKEVHKDGTTVIRFNNGDVETKFSGGTMAYFHANDRVMQISNTADGSTLFEYPNRQIERHYKDGSKAILFADGTRQRISATGKVETAFAETAFAK